jgi:hypothetical protein
VNWPEVRISNQDGDVKWVLCVSSECGVRLARIGAQNDGDIVIGSGWVEEEGPSGMNIWRMSRRSRERFLRGRPAAYRRSPAEGLLLVDLREYGRGEKNTPKEFGRLLWPLPALIICPRCQRTQLIAADMPSTNERRATIPPTEDPGIRSG